MLNLERERDKFLHLCKEMQNRNPGKNVIKVAGEPIIGIADEFAD